MTNLTAEALVSREVHYCVSSLVSTLAKTDSYIMPQKGDRNCEANVAHYDVCIAAQELCWPQDDFEETAVQAGWYRTSKTGPTYWRNDAPEHDGYKFATAQDVCDEYDLDVQYREVFEHWIVSDWLADKLAEKGEKVDKDFAGLTVWARTTPGQGIASDSVIAAIVRDLNAP